jgi:hypothetical protein
MKALKSAFTDTLFESWFRNSKVVDSQNKPLVVFHATASEFDPYAFNPLSHFGSAKAAGDLYEFMDDYSGTRVFPVFLNIKNPMKIILAILINTPYQGHNINIALDMTWKALPKT